MITGSRSWVNPFVISQAIDEVLWPYFNLPLPEGIDGDKTPVIVHGACATGADHYADLYAKWKHYIVEKYPAEWDKYGRAAGPKRNQLMVDKGADVVLGFRHANSRGTLHCINAALKAKLNVIVYEGAQYDIS